jgi:hypothetical protein
MSKCNGVKKHLKEITLEDNTIQQLYLCKEIYKIFVCPGIMNDAKTTHYQFPPNQHEER